jgi:RNA polymerase sigma-70 factor (ECF subfamily)
LWDKDKITHGESLLIKALIKSKIGPYQLQAAISALHSTAASFADTDWEEITLLYDKLYTLEPTPVILLNTCVALSFAQGPAKGLAALRPIQRSGALKDYQPYYAAHADMLRRDRQVSAALKVYKKALTLTITSAEKQYIESKITHLMNI